MSLTKETVQYLEAHAKAGELVQGDSHHQVLVPENMRLESVEHLQKYRHRFRGTMETSHIDSFADYTNKQHEASGDTKCFIDPDQPIASACFDIGTINQPGHMKHHSRLKLKETAAYTALTGVDGRRIEQRYLAEYMEDWAHCIRAVDPNGITMDTKKAIDAVRKITIESVANAESELRHLSTTKSTLEKVEASSGSNPLPAWLYVSLEPYFGLQSYEFPVRLSIGISRSEFTFTLAISNHEKRVEEMLAEFKRIVQYKLNDDIETLIGTFAG